jgi:hypothetical protein
MSDIVIRCAKLNTEISLYREEMGTYKELGIIYGYLVPLGAYRIVLRILLGNRQLGRPEFLYLFVYLILTYLRSCKILRRVE